MLQWHVNSFPLMRALSKHTSGFFVIIIYADLHGNKQYTMNSKFRQIFRLYHNAALVIFSIPFSNVKDSPESMRDL